MPSVSRLWGLLLCAALCGPTNAQDQLGAPLTFGPYLYESKPDDPAFTKFNPRQAPEPGPLLLRQGDRLAIIGDSITEQKMYSRIIETYLTVCVPELEITARQYGWSGEKADGFYRRMDQDCLRFHPTVATLCYGMNDSRYRPFDVTNGEWYRDYYTAVVRKLKAGGARVVVGSPGCAGKIAAWVKSRNGTLDEHNLNLCAFAISQLESPKRSRFALPMSSGRCTRPTCLPRARTLPRATAIFLSREMTEFTRVGPVT